MVRVHDGVLAREE